jgi:hypothetical protein
VTTDNRMARMGRKAEVSIGIQPSALYPWFGDSTARSPFRFLRLLAFFAANPPVPQPSSPLRQPLTRIFHGRKSDANQVAIRMKNPGSI